MKELYFENLQDIGNLYLDKVFNSFEGEDIIFVCTDENGSYYFCVCYEFRYQLCWIAVITVSADFPWMRQQIF